jgi:hypothetical protein
MRLQKSDRAASPFLYCTLSSIYPGCLFKHFKKPKVTLTIYPEAIEVLVNAQNFLFNTQDLLLWLLSCLSSQRTEHKEGLIKKERDMK